MDALEDHAASCCSHLSKTVRCYIINMIDMLVSMGDTIPATPAERYVAYKKHGIPEAIYLEYDGEATQRALAKISET